MKHLTRLVSLSLIVFLINLVTTQPSLAIPSLPSSFYGTVQVNGANVPEGTVIQALIGGQVYADGVSQTYQGSSVYALDVRGDNTDTAVQDGGREGDVVQIAVGGALATQSGTWHSGSNVQLDVTVAVSGEPVWTPVPTVPVATPTVQPSSTPTLTPISTQQSLPTITPSLTTTPLPTQGSSPTVRPLQPIAPSPISSRTPTQRPSSTPLESHPTSQVLSPTPTELVVSNEQSTPTLEQSVQQAVASTEPSTVTSTLTPTSTSIAILKQSSSVAVLSATTEEAVVGDAPSGALSTAILVLAVGSAAIGFGLVLWAIRRAK